MEFSQDILNSIEQDLCLFTKKRSKTIRKKSLIEYYQNPVHCKICGAIIFIKPRQSISEAKKVETCSHKCKVALRKIRRDEKYAKQNEIYFCLNCGTSISRKKKFCNNNCQHEYAYKQYINNWKQRIIDGTIGNAWIDLSKYIRRYLFEKYNNQCAQCGWGEINPFTGTLPLEVEHIDGDATNNKEENLILLCPNCHSLTKTYRGANKGNGKREIKWLSRKGLTTNVFSDEMANKF